MVEIREKKTPKERKRSITQAGGLDISDVTKMGRAFITNLKKLSKEDRYKFPTSLLAGILRIVEPRTGTTAMYLDKVAKSLKNKPEKQSERKKGKAFKAGGMAKKKVK
tara:strand:- start:236 stop:559 length:324 start_codon:yes stop_codon:yes gene_type:complete